MKKYGLSIITASICLSASIATVMSASATSTGSVAANAGARVAVKGQTGSRRSGSLTGAERRHKSSRTRC